MYVNTGNDQVCTWMISHRDTEIGMESFFKVDKNREHKKREEDILVDMWVACDLEHKGKKMIGYKNKVGRGWRKRLEEQVEQNGLILQNMGLGDEGTARIMHERPIIPREKDAVLVTPRDKYTYGECVEWQSGRRVSLQL